MNITQIPPEHSGFVQGRGTYDQLINVHQMIEKLYKSNVPAIFWY